MESPCMVCGRYFKNVTNRPEQVTVKSSNEFMILRAPRILTRRDFRALCASAGGARHERRTQRSGPRPAGLRGRMCCGGACLERRAPAECSNNGRESALNRNPPSPAHFQSPRREFHGRYSRSACVYCAPQESPMSHPNVIARCVYTFRNQRSRGAPVCCDPAPTLSESMRVCAMTRRFYREILLAAFLIMCNAAENFLPLRWKSCERSKISAVKRNFSVARHAERRKDSLSGLSRWSNRPLQLERALCLLL